MKMLAKTHRMIGLCSTANFINAADRIIMPMAIIPMTDQFQWSLYWQGWVLSAFAFGYITSQVLHTIFKFNIISILCPNLPSGNRSDRCLKVWGKNSTDFGCIFMVWLQIFNFLSFLMFFSKFRSISTLITPLVAYNIHLLIICRVVLGLGEGLGLILITL